MRAENEDAGLMYVVFNALMVTGMAYIAAAAPQRLGLRDASKRELDYLAETIFTSPATAMAVEECNRLLAHLKFKLVKIDEPDQKQEKSRV